MAESSLGVTLGTGANVRTRTTAGGIHQQAVVITDGVTDSSVNAAVDAVGLTVRPGKTATPTTSRVAAAITSTQLLAANANRLNASIYNDSTDTLYVKYGTAAAATSKKFALKAGEYWEMPTGGTIHTGIIHGLWTGTNGAADISEETA